MKRIFVSYRSQDRETVSDLIIKLRERGFDVWYDIDLQLAVGQVWWSNILKAIREADIILVAISDARWSSEACESELRYAEALSKTLLPVQVSSTITLGLVPRNIQQLQMHRHFVDSPFDGFENLIIAIAQLPPSPPLTNPLPIDEPPTPISPLVDIRDMLRINMLSYDQQREIVNQLGDHLDAKLSPSEEIYDLLAQIKQRPDLSRGVEQQIDRLLTQRKQETPSVPQSQLSSIPRHTSKSLWLILIALLILTIIGVVFSSLTRSRLFAQMEVIYSDPDSLTLHFTDESQIDTLMIVTSDSEYRFAEVADVQGRTFTSGDCIMLVIEGREPPPPIRCTNLPLRLDLETEGGFWADINGSLLPIQISLNDSLTECQPSISPDDVCIFPVQSQ